MNYITVERNNPHAIQFATRVITMQETTSECYIAPMYVLRLSSRLLPSNRLRKNCTARSLSEPVIRKLRAVQPILRGIGTMTLQLRHSRNGGASITGHPPTSAANMGREGVQATARVARAHQVAAMMENHQTDVPVPLRREGEAGTKVGGLIARPTLPVEVIPESRSPPTPMTVEPGRVANIGPLATPIKRPTSNSKILMAVRA